MTIFLAHAGAAHLAGTLFYCVQLALALGFIAWCLRLILRPDTPRGRRAAHRQAPGWRQR